MMLLQLSTNNFTGICSFGSAFLSCTQTMTSCRSCFSSTAALSAGIHLVHKGASVHLCVSSHLKHKHTSVRLCVTNTALLIRQTLLVQIFAPLARLLGLYSIKEELEELSFKFSNPEAHGQMVKRIRVLSETQHDVVQAVSRSHQTCFVIEHISCTHLLTHSLH